MAYNTGNPIGSTSPRDLYDNAENLDEAMNKEGAAWTNRLGVQRKTWSGIQDSVNDLIVAGGRIFESEAAGRAEVNDGDYYYVEGSIPSVATEIWRKVSDSSSERVSDAPSESYVKDSAKSAHRRIQQVAALTTSEGMALVLSDADGKSILEVAPDGSLYLSGMGEGSAVQDLLNNPEFVLTGGEQTLRTSLALSSSNDDVLAVVGANDELVLRIDADGRLIIPSETGDTATDVASSLGGLQRYLSTNSDDADKLLEVADDNGDAVATLGRFGELFLTQMDGRSIQRVLAHEAGDAALRLVDDADNMMVEIKGEGSLMLPGLWSSVQESIVGRDNVQGGGKRRSPQDMAPQSVLNMATMAGDGCPPPLGLVPSARQIGDQWIEELQATQSNKVELITPYFPRSGVVHPYVIEMYDEFCGWRYIMTITGYTLSDNQEENPFLYGSNDLENWELITDVLAEPDVIPDARQVYNSDSFLAYDPRTKELIVCWRQTADFFDSEENQTRLNWIYASRTKNLVTWTDREVLFGETDGVSNITLSPSVLMDHDTGLWHFYEITGSQIHHYTSDVMGEPWVKQSSQSFSEINKQPWHFEVKFVGDRLVALTYCRKGDTERLYMGVADKGDFSGFTFGSQPVMDDAGRGLYKSSFVPEFKGDDMRLHLITTSNLEAAAIEDKWRLYIDSTQYTNWKTNQA